MKVLISEEELAQRIALNKARLCDEYYDIDHVFMSDDADWPGDKEGRALLAFVSHYKIDQTKIPCMEQMIAKIPEITGGKLFFGPKTNDVIFEQQLSGTSWYLRGLCEYYEQFSDEAVPEYLHAVFRGIYLPTKGRFASYPTEREKDAGGVDGHTYGRLHGWLLSTDIGCAFMSIDGLSHYYKISKNPEALALIEEMAECFDRIDKCALQAQTHCSLTAARGFMRMLEVTGDHTWLDRAERLFQLYVDHGMTYTYQNYNWFQKGDTWTEPCAIVDSLMLSLMLYQATGRSAYRTYAARIYFNGLATSQRPNGGAGTDTTVSDRTAVLQMQMYEAPFCCTMRLAEGLWYIHEHRDLLYAEMTGRIEQDAIGRYADGDILYAEIRPEHEKYAGAPRLVGGHKLFPLIRFYTLPSEAECARVVQKIVFPLQN